MYPDVSRFVAYLGRLRSRAGAASHDKSGVNVNTDASSEQDVEAGREHKLENGLLGIAEVSQQDVMYMLTPKLTRQSMYLAQTEAVRLLELWQELEHARVTNSDKLAEITRNYHHHHTEYLQLMHLIRETAKLRSPPAKFFNGFQAVLAHSLHGPEAALRTGLSDDWVMLHGLDLPDIWVRNAAEYRWVEFVLQLFGSRINHDGGVTSMEYPIGVFFTIVYALISCVMAAFLGIPVALQALDVASPKAYVGAYIAFLFVFSIIMQLSMPGYAMQLVLSLAYAAVLVANMKNSDA
ncbi:hypothetical protein NW754_011766 [Fusarium falciforme]|nr:hypothetical protein NW754_011766 [Fusarium falciforme]